MFKDKFEIRTITPEDKQGLLDGFALLSNESRRQRFFSSRQNFTEKELHFFTEVDQHDHIAYVAISHEITGNVPAGSIRCIRDPHRPHFAELAITIVDRFQGQGLGGEFMEIIAKKALSENLTHFYGDFHTSNNKMLKLLERYCAKHQIPENDLHLSRNADGFLYFEMPLA